MVITEQQLIDAFPLSCTVLDCEGNVLYVNAEWKRQFGMEDTFSSSLSVGGNCFYYLSSECRPPIGVAATLMDQLIKEGEIRQEVVMTPHEGDVVTAEFCMRTFQDEKDDTRVLCTFRDVTEKLRNERERSFHYSLMDQLFEHSPNGIVLVDEQNRITRSNEAFKQLFGYHEKELAGQNIDSLIIPLESSVDKEAEWSIRTLSGVSLQRETVRCHKDGTEIPVLLGTVPVYVKGEVAAAYGIYVDLSERVRLENRVGELLKVEKSARMELEVLLQEVHHRVKNNLAVIVGLMDLQMMDAMDLTLTDRLKEVQSRIYSIAQIHESIYQQKDLLRVRFDEYLTGMLPTWQEDDRVDMIQTSLESVTLNLNQAVTAGLLANEVFNMMFHLGRSTSSGVNVSLWQAGRNICLEFESKMLDRVDMEMMKSGDFFNMKIVDVLLNQLDAGITISQGNPARLLITFVKAEVKGSSSSFI